MFHIVIPARYSSSRLPGKPLMKLQGRPLIQWVWDCAQNTGAQSITVATDDERIRDAVLGFGARCVMTGYHESGTDRVAEVVRRSRLAPKDIVLNLQGDEPMVPKALIIELVADLESMPSADIATAIAPIQSLSQFTDANCVKAIRAQNGLALYFSRAPIPWPRDSTTATAGTPTGFRGAFRHIGIYAYRVDSLLRFSQAQPTSLEQTEKLEQLRALEMGMSIYLTILEKGPPAGVDTLEDLNRVNEMLSSPP